MWQFKDRILMRSICSASNTTQTDPDRQREKHCSVTSENVSRWCERQKNASAKHATANTKIRRKGFEVKQTVAGPWGQERSKHLGRSHL